MSRDEPKFELKRSPPTEQTSAPNRFNRPQFEENRGYNQRPQYSNRGYNDNRGFDNQGYGSRGYGNYGGYENRGYRNQGYGNSYGYGNNRGGYESNRGYQRRGRGYGNRRQGRGYRSDEPRHSEFKFFCQTTTVPDPEFERRHYKNGHGNLQGIEFDKYDEVKVTTMNYAFEPCESFALLHPVLQQNVALCGFKKPTPIQKYCIPVMANFQDLVACAETGSGKTAAFLLPLIHCLLIHKSKTVGFHSRSRCYPKALIIAPTRELAQQIYSQCCKLIYTTGFSCSCIFGGSKIDDQIKILESTQIEILVCTPGRLWDFYEREKISLEDVNYLVLDEADRMLDMGFERQLNNIIYESDMNQERTNMLFSATIDQKLERTIAGGFLKNYAFLACGRVGGASKMVEQRFEYIGTYQKEQRLVEFLKNEKGQVLVFCQTKRKCDEVEDILNDENINAEAIHGDKSQRAREKALNRFRKKHVRALIATDVASRGLDIKDVAYVIQLDMPNDIDSYVHRIGRTGRCGNRGVAIAYINEKNKSLIGDIIKSLKEEGKEIPADLVRLHRKTMHMEDRGYGNRRGGYGNRRRGYGKNRRGGYGNRHKKYDRY